MSRSLLVAACLAGLFIAAPIGWADSPTDATAKTSSDTSGKDPQAQTPVRNNLVVKNYPVADLVALVQSADSKPDGTRPANPPDFDTLTKIIERTIQPDTWGTKGGAGSARPFLTTLSLVIRQTESAHDEIAELIGRLRNALDRQVVIEMKYIRLPENLVPLLGAEAKTGGIVLSNDEAHRLVKKARDQSAIVCAPTLIALSGHPAVIMISKDPVSPCEFGIKIHAEIDADRRTVSMKLASPRGSSDAVLASAMTVSIANGATVLCDVTRLLEILHRAESAKPGSPLENPAVREVLRRFKPDSTRDMLLLTPRIIIPEEKVELIGVERK